MASGSDGRRGAGRAAASARGARAPESRTRTLVGRADLVRLAAEMEAGAMGPGDLESVARWMGFEREQSSSVPEPPPFPPIDDLRVPPEPIKPIPPPPPPIPVEKRSHSIAFLRLEEVSFTDNGLLAPPPPERREGLTADDLDPKGRSLFSPLQMPPLAPWRRLWPLLRDRLQIVRTGVEIDVRGITRMLGRGQVVSHIPRLLRSAWTPRLTIWRDNSHRLSPWSADQYGVQRALQRVCGKAAVQIRYLDDSHAASPETEPGGRPVRVDPGSPILVLGDLGAYGSEQDSEAWRRAAQRLRGRGARIFALVAASRQRTGSSTFTEWNAIAWERVGLRPSPGFHEDAIPKEKDAEREQARQREQRQRRDKRAEELLVLSSAAAVVQPGLLRVLRRLLPVSEADFSTEVAAWNHPDVAAAGPSGLVLYREARERYRARLAYQSPKLLRRVRDAIAEWHARLPKEIVHAEAIAWSAHILEGPGSDALVPVPSLGDLKAASQFVWRLLNSAEAKKTPAGLSREDLRRACETFRSLVPDDLSRFEDSALREALERMGRVAVFNGKEPGPSEACGVSIVGRSLVLRKAPAGGAWPAHDPTKDPGSPLSWLPATRGRLRVLRGRGAERVEERHDIGAGLHIEVKEGEDLVLETDQCRLVYRFWSPEPWASGVGRDRFGLWADMEVKGVVQRFRWIPPGRFLMGSPEGEAGREDWEGPQHQVTFTRGYWLADTPCTQALWEAVMGSNPSRFVSPDRPVEKVSWDDCQTFLDRLREVSRDLACLLPGEAEWEHACRAGTSTATWLGDLDIRGDNDAPLLDKIAWYGGNCGVEFDLEKGYDTSGWPDKQFPHKQGGTRRVQQKDASPLGLYDMIGNVFEWCADTNNDYRPDDMIDPEPAQGGGNRVVRGGSWVNYARCCRAAYRDWNDPANARYYVGFRLVRGRAPSKEAEPQEAEPQEKGAEPREGTRSGPDNGGAGRVPVEAKSRDATEPPTKIAKTAASSDRTPPERRR